MRPHERSLAAMSDNQSQRDVLACVAFMIVLGFHINIKRCLYKLTLTLSASRLAISDEFWYLIMGHFLRDKSSAVRPCVERCRE